MLYYYTLLYFLKKIINMLFF